MDNLIKSLPKLLTLSSQNEPVYQSITEIPVKSQTKSHTRNATIPHLHKSITPQQPDPQDSNYFNVSSYRFSSQLKDKDSLNISGYINIYSDKADPQISNTKRAALLRNSLQLEQQNKARGSTHLFSQSSQERMMLLSASTTDDSDCGCLELGHPEMNYFNMNMRFTSTATDARNNTSNLETKSYLQSRPTLKLTEEASKFQAWRQRSLTPDTAELMASRSHKTIYADLIINQCSSNTNTTPPSSPPTNRHKAEPQANYIEIDIRKTMDLTRLDTDLNRQKSKKKKKQQQSQFKRFSLLTRKSKSDQSDKQEDSTTNQNVFKKIWKKVNRSYMKSTG